MRKKFVYYMYVIKFCGWNTFFIKLLVRFGY